MGEFDLRSRQMSWRPYVMMWVHIYLDLSSFHCQSAIRANLQILYLFVELLKVYQLLHSHVLLLLMHLTLALACTDRYMHLFCLVDFYDLISRIDNNNVRSRTDKTNALLCWHIDQQAPQDKKNGNKLLLSNVDNYMPFGNWTLGSTNIWFNIMHKQTFGRKLRTRWRFVILDRKLNCYSMHIATL